jgi:hypothetical protein
MLIFKHAMLPKNSMGIAGTRQMQCRLNSGAQSCCLLPSVVKGHQNIDPLSHAIRQNPQIMGGCSLNQSLRYHHRHVLELTNRRESGA